MLDCKVGKRKDVPGGVENLEVTMESLSRFKAARIDCPEDVLDEEITNLDGVGGGSFA